MRKKVLEYLKNPSPKKRDELTTMEQKFIDAQPKSNGKKDDKKPKS